MFPKYDRTRPGVIMEIFPVLYEPPSKFQLSYRVTVRETRTKPCLDVATSRSKRFLDLYIDRQVRAQHGHGQGEMWSKAGQELCKKHRSMLRSRADAMVGTSMEISEQRGFKTVSSLDHITSTRDPTTHDECSPVACHGTRHNILSFRRFADPQIPFTWLQAFSTTSDAHRKDCTKIQPRPCGRQVCQVGSTLR